MGFSLRCVVLRCDGDDDPARLIAALEALPYARVRRFPAPFAGVIAGSAYLERWDDWQAHPERYAYPDEDAAMAAIYEGLEDGLPALSRAWPGRRFAYVDVDCFGGTCLYRGHVVVDGAVGLRLERASHDGHQRLFAALGVVDPPWHFPPFARGFFEGVEPSEVRRAITGVITGAVRFPVGIGALAVMLLDELRAPWQLSVMGETALLACGGDDVLLSINARAGAYELGGRAHLPMDETAGRLDALARALDAAGMGFDLALADLERRVLRRWHGDD